MRISLGAAWVGRNGYFQARKCIFKGFSKELDTALPVWDHIGMCIQPQKKELQGDQTVESSPLRKALLTHFKEFKGLTEQAKPEAPIYKDTESEAENEHAA